MSLCYGYMFTLNHVAAYRAQVVEAMAERDLAGLLSAQRALETHQEGVCEDFARGDGGKQNRRSEALQPHGFSVATGG